jgi:hypothetical protein
MSNPDKPGRGSLDGVDSSSRPRGKETSRIEQAKIEADKAIALAKIAAEVEKTKIAEVADTEEKRIAASTSTTRYAVAALAVAGFVLLGCVAYYYGHEPVFSLLGLGGYGPSASAGS